MLGVSRAANAQNIYFPNDTTINHDVSGYAIVGYANDADYSNRRNGTSPTIYFADTSSINSIGGFMIAYNNSIINFTGGIIRGGSSSKLFSLAACDNAAVNVSGGVIAQILPTYNNSSLNVTGGSIGALNAFDSSRIAVANGNIGHMGFIDNSVVNFKGGSASDLSANGKNITNISGGSIASYLYIGGNSTINVTGGVIHGNALNVSNVFAVEAGSSILNLFGTGFSDTLSNPMFNGGGLTPIYYSQYALSGALADGTSVNGDYLYVLNGSKAKVTFNGKIAIDAAVPEPGGVALLAGLSCAGGWILRKRAGRRHDRAIDGIV